VKKIIFSLFAQRPGTVKNEMIQDISIENAKRPSKTTREAYLGQP
jgi:hypothetical protein